MTERDAEKIILDAQADKSPLAIAAFKFLALHRSESAIIKAVSEELRNLRGGAK